METIQKKDVLNMAAVMCAGVFSNPALATSVADQYQRQQIIQSIIWDVKMAIEATGITITD